MRDWKASCERIQVAISISRQSEATSLSLSVLAHLVVVAALTQNLSLWEQKPASPVRLAIDASLVLDNSALQERQQLAERERQREAERVATERQRQADERERLVEQERQRQADEQQREAAAKLEQQRRADAAEREKAEAEAQAKAQAERERVAAEQAAKRKAAEAAAEAERRRLAAERQRQQESEAQLLAQLAAEEERDSAVSAGQLDQWRELIRQRIQRNWVKPASAGAGINCEVRVTQIPGGEVIEVTVGRCNGDDAVVRSIENAVLHASPLPPPPNPSLFERRLILDFVPEN